MLRLYCKSTKSSSYCRRCTYNDTYYVHNALAHLVAQLCRGWLEAAVKYMLDSDRGDKPRKLEAAQSRVSLGGLPCFGLGVVARQNLRGIGMLAVVELSLIHI